MTPEQPGRDPSPKRPYFGRDDDTRVAGEATVALTPDAARQVTEHVPDPSTATFITVQRLGVALTQAAALVGFWYKMPTSGLLEVWIQAQCSFARHQLTLLDEWDVLDASIRQDNQIAFRAQGGGIATQMRTSVGSGFYLRRDTSGTWTVENITPGQKFWAHLFSDVAFLAGTWVHVEVGTQTLTSEWTNDIQATSRTDFRYFIPQAAVGSTGG
ncbi:hypothetical protein [Streptomyces virginiae]|uniref:Uncharacterized protein n=1 Tax=Streptomyces virginiae TaxID=1961 RepID=A0ABZ1TSI6_STRVG|nr:hypothetical protein [Streptomyces virginiae]